MRARTRPGFARSLAFAAAAGLAAVPWLLLAAPVVGRAWSVALLALGCAVAHVVWVAPNPRRALVAGGTTALLAALVALAALPLPPGAALTAAVLAAAVLVAVGRSVLLVRRPAARALALEAALLAGGLLAARFLAGPSPLDLGLAVWGFFLVQALYGLVGGGVPRREDAAGDPFERARRRALALMEP